jgi:hypothetical protein
MLRMGMARCLDELSQSFSELIELILEHADHLEHMELACSRERSGTASPFAMRPISAAIDVHTRDQHRS